MNGKSKFGARKDFQKQLTDLISHETLEESYRRESS